MDEGTNAMVSYTLTSSDVPFRLEDSNPGDIFVDGPLDREVTSNYTLHVNNYVIIIVRDYSLCFIIDCGYRWYS